MVIKLKVGAMVSYRIGLKDKLPLRNGKDKTRLKVVT
jgi:hypothetical protein